MIDYKTKLHEDITQMYAKTKSGELSREVRLPAIERLIDDYLEKTDEIPDGSALERLADLCLYEELTDRNEHKVLHTEYPILSEHQFDRRERVEIPVKDKTLGMNAADGKTHDVPHKRQRSPYENKFIDKKVRSRNRERKRAYLEFVRTQPVIIIRRVNI